MCSSCIAMPKSSDLVGLTKETNSGWMIFSCIGTVSWFICSVIRFVLPPSCWGLLQKVGPMPDLDLWQRRVESYMRWLWVRAKVNELVLQTAAPAAPVQLTRQLSTPPSVMPVPQVLDRKGFAAVLGVSVKTIDNMRAR